MSKMTRDGKRRVELRIDPDLYTKARYFADKDDVSVNEFLQRSLEHYIAFIVSDYDLPSAEVKRLNQLIDNMHNINTRMEVLEKAVNHGFDGVNALMSTNNYLDEGDNNGSR